MSQQQHSNSDMNTVRLCPSCNTPLSKGERFCGQCGHSLFTESGVYPTSAGTESGSLRPKRSTLSSMLYILVIIVLAVGLVLEVFGILPRLPFSLHPAESTASTTPYPKSTVSPTPASGSTVTPASTTTNISTPIYSSANWQGWNPVDPVHNSWSSKGGVLYSDGTDNREQIAPTIVSSFQVSGTDDYATEAKIRVISWSPYDKASHKFTSGFGLTFRGTSGSPWTGYMLECFNTDFYGAPPTCYIANNLLSLSLSSLASSRYKPGNDSHTYSIKVKGNHIDVSIDGTPRLSVQDSEFPHGGQIGLWTTNTALAVTSLTVSTLS